MSMNFFKEIQGGVELQIRAIPGSKKSEVKDIWNGKLRVKISAIPEGGKANEELISFFSEYFDVAKSSVIIIHGEKCKDKVVRIFGVSGEDLGLKMNNQQQALGIR